MNADRQNHLPLINTDDTDRELVRRDIGKAKPITADLRG
jgi:hypothetical protein